MSYYLPSVLIEQVGLTEHTAQLVTGINAITYLVFSSVAIPLVERWGRRSLFLISTVGQGLAFLIITILLKYASEGSKGSATASIPFFFIYYIAFGLGALGIPWLYPTEINSIAMRTKGAATATATNWVGFPVQHEYELTADLRTDYQLRYCTDDASWHQASRLEVLDRFHCLQRRLRSCVVLVLPRDR